MKPPDPANEVLSNLDGLAATKRLFGEWKREDEAADDKEQLDTTVPDVCQLISERVVRVLEIEAWRPLRDVATQVMHDNRKDRQGSQSIDRRNDSAR
jgi:hypothetical protein